MAASDNKLSVQLSVITVFQIFVSFAMQWYVVTWFGAGGKTDAFYSGATLTQMTTILLIESFTVVVVPLLATFSGDKLRELVWFLFVGSIAVFAIISLLLYLISPLVVPWMVPGLSAEAKRLTVSMTRVQVFGLIGAAGYAVLSGSHQVRARFVVPPASVLISAVVSFAILMWQLPRFGILLAPWCWLLSVTLPALLLSPILGKPGWPKSSREVIKTILTRMRPLVLSKAYYMTSAPLDRALASFLQPGSIVVFELAGRFYNAVVRIISQGVVTPFIPRLSRLAHNQIWDEFRVQYRKQSIMVAVPSLSVVVVIVIGGLIGLRLIPSDPSSRVIGSINAETLSRILRVLIYMAGLLPCMAFANSLTNCYYAKADTRTPTRIGVVAYTLGVGVKIAGYYFGGIMGMALAVTIYAVLLCLVLYVTLERQTTRLIGSPASATAAALVSTAGANSASSAV